MQSAVLSNAVEDKVFKEIHGRVVKSFLDVVVLMELRNGKPLSGNAAISTVYKKFGVLLSSGTVYSQLYSLERNGLIKAHLTQGRRDYTLTEKGKETIRAILNARDKITALTNTIF